MAVADYSGGSTPLQMVKVKKIDFDSKFHKLRTENRIDSDTNTPKASYVNQISNISKGGAGGGAAGSLSHRSKFAKRSGKSGASP